MIDTPPVWWLSVALAVVLLVDALMSVRPPQFIQGCLDGVGFPREWWWALIVVKLLAVVGLIAGLTYRGVAFTTNLAVIAYFLCAAYAHFRAQFLRREFWLNCLGLLGLSVVVLVVSYTGVIA